MLLAAVWTRRFRQENHDLTLLTIDPKERTAVGAHVGAGGQFELARRTFKKEGDMTMGAAFVIVVDSLVAARTERLATFAAKGVDRIDCFATIGTRDVFDLDLDRFVLGSFVC